MATAEQIKSLIRSHFGNEIERFSTIALQVAAHEAKQGHTALAFEIRELVDEEHFKKKQSVRSTPQDLQGLVRKEDQDTLKSALVIPDTLNIRIERIIHEYRQQNKLKAHGLDHRRKILLIGPPGTGKTMTARVLAKELHLMLYTIQVDRLITKFMGESSAKLRQIFDLIQQEHGIYLFDEFDAIGGERSIDNDVGEMRRVLNAFLQFIDQDQSDSLIVAATNNPKLLDQALFRRFDDVLYYEAPQPEDRKLLIKNILGTFISKRFIWQGVIETSADLSHAEIDHACRDAIKNVILSDQTKVSHNQLLQTLKERQGAHQGS
ncbi:MAG: ATP-binding protein [Blastochloris sp.]|nr:ATP-binding protein [Blastochloris sp.]